MAREKAHRQTEGDKYEAGDYKPEQAGIESHLSALRTG